MKPSSSKVSLKTFKLLHHVLFNEMIDKQIMLTTKALPSRNANPTDAQRFKILSKSLDVSPRDASMCSMLKVVKGKAIELPNKVAPIKV